MIAGKKHSAGASKLLAPQRQFTAAWPRRWRAEQGRRRVGLSNLRHLCTPVAAAPAPQYPCTSTLNSWGRHSAASRLIRRIAVLRPQRWRYMLSQLCHGQTGRAMDDNGAAGHAC
jgi:uncharacterized protein (DUF2461 family)